MSASDYDGICSQIRGEVDVFQGAQAYEFLVQFACGLKSEVIGETDVFGQFKEAWKKFQSLDSEVASELSSWMQKVFEDTKEIRSLYLQNLGGASYGSLTRDLLNDSSDSPVLVLGAGQLAASVIPWLSNHQILLWNRTFENAQKMVSELKPEVSKKIRILKSQEELDLALLHATHVVSCIPDLPAAAESVKGKIIDLGSERKSNHPRLFTLSDVFAEMKSRSEVRSMQVVQAQRACHERSKLRALGGSLSIAHGWEDLAVFA